MTFTPTMDHERPQVGPVETQYRAVSETFAIAPTVSVVIPVKDEARNLPIVLRSLPTWVDEVVLVDGHSVDDTVAVARACRPDIKIVTQPKKGKGDALRAGFKACTGDIVVMMDGDGSTGGEEIVRFVSALVAGADYAKGSRFANSGGSDDITPARRLGNHVLSGMVNLAFGTHYTDLCYGYNALWSKHLAALDLDCGGFEIETVMNIRAAKAALRVQEIPSHERRRVHGESNLHVLFDGWRILKAIRSEAFGSFRRRSPRGQAAPSVGTPSNPAPTHHEPNTESSPPAVPAMISVVICAHAQERWHETCAAIDSVQEQSFPCKEIIVVVDHNPPLHAALAAAYPGVMVVENSEEPGLSGARNSGVALTKGDVVAFLDDDAVADPDWLKFFADSYADPEVIGVGGLTVANWKVPRPSWFPAEFDWVVGCNYRGMAESGTPVRNLLGGNSSFRREAFELAGGFQNGIGRTAAKRPLGCEETEFCIRLNQQSPRSVLLIDERAMIWHLVPPDRSRLSYFHRRCYAEGLSKALVTASVGARDGLSAERRYTTRTLPLGAARGLRDLLRGDVSGLGKAGAITTGVTSTVAGYVVGSVTRRARRIQAAGAAKAAARATPGR
jgi:glucosyl-dolichyl phosphate glucuronosyltransferase